jgi:hypothetical protein
MNAHTITRALLRLATSGAVLAELTQGRGYGVFPRGDKRRRATVKLDDETVRQLEADGVVEPLGDVLVLTVAGRARVRREAATGEEGYLAQHATLTDRDVMEKDGEVRRTRGVMPSAVIRRLAALRGADGTPWLSGAEISAAECLRAHWETAQGGLTRGSDWTAPPVGSSPRGPSTAQERTLAARCDARRRTEEALDALAPPLRRVVERVCFNEDGLETLERAHGWPARSGKVALKLGLAQLACSGITR